jgi:hypothetical protein
VTPQPRTTLPGAPTGVSAVAGDGFAIVSFTPPASNGGAAITAYTVTASPGGQTATASSGPILVPGLADGTSYTFTVTATNAVGTGPASTPSNAVTPSLPDGPRQPPPDPPAPQARPAVPAFTPPSGPRVPPPGH